MKKTVGYVLTPKGIPDYYYVGPTIGCSMVKEAALVYVSRHVAEIAAKLIRENEKDVWGVNFRPFVVRKVES